MTVANPLILDQAGVLVRLRDCRTLPVRGWALAVDDRPRDICGRPRSPITWPKNRKGLKPGNAGKTYPPSPPTEVEALAILDRCKPAPHGVRDRALLALIWRTGLRIHEALLLELEDLDERAGTVTVRRGKGGKYRVVGMDPWGFEQLVPWLTLRPRYPGRLVFPIVEGPTRGGRIGQPYVRTKLRRLADEAGVHKRVTPHQWRHALAVSLAREGVQMHLVQRQLGHSNLGTTATYLSSIAPQEAVNAIHARQAPTGGGTA